MLQRSPQDDQAIRRTSDSDKIVGQNLRELRTKCGYSQERLALALGMSFQQIQKYEKGENRISAGRLWEISKVLDIDVKRLFEGCPR